MEAQHGQHAPAVTMEPKRKILIVEDEKDIRDLLRYNLEAEGFIVLEADDGLHGKGWIHLPGHHHADVVGVIIQW